MGCPGFGKTPAGRELFQPKHERLGAQFSCGRVKVRLPPYESQVNSSGGLTDVNAYLIELLMKQDRMSMAA
jgi:hypothetical protein